MKTFNLVEATFSKNGEEQTLHGFVDADKNFELIDTIKTTETARLVINQEPDGTPYEFSAVFIEINGEFEQEKWKEWIISSKANSIAGEYRIGRGYSVDSNAIKIECYLHNGLWRFSLYKIDSENKSTLASTESFYIKKEQNDLIRNVYLDGIKENTTIKIYGVR